MSGTPILDPEFQPAYARHLVRLALKTGALPDPESQFCFLSLPDCQIEADRFHHVDVYKPLEVFPICRTCEQNLHYSRRHYVTEKVIEQMREEWEAKDIDAQHDWEDWFSSVGVETLMAGALGGKDLRVVGAIVNRSRWNSGQFDEIGVIKTSEDADNPRIMGIWALDHETNEFEPLRAAHRHSKRFAARDMVNNG